MKMVKSHVHKMLYTGLQVSIHRRGQAVAVQTHRDSDSKFGSVTQGEFAQPVVYLA